MELALSTILEADNGRTISISLGVTPTSYDNGSNDVNGTRDDSLYQTERNGEFTYEIPVPVGSYEFIVHFAKQYWSGFGKKEVR